MLRRREDYFVFDSSVVSGGWGFFRFFFIILYVGKCELYYFRSFSGRF